ncbi:superoxide dismutase family protein [Arthrobacter mobilis]|uniref:Superoxide dismutase family protein n=1 Tax=Arthrobacter mobilis TaxID=2724944 RepID=A0A7X6HA74_9MICC|nr:superoxide dismutase family protein [Arthrobacter mobilis]NKX53336.1 superoxide dismutase family protein [Arthrobacter mobilis]
MGLKPGKTTLAAVGAAALVLALTGCGEKERRGASSGDMTEIAPASPTTTGSFPAGEPVVAQFNEFEDSAAITYNQTVVPKGSNVEVLVQSQGSGTTVRLAVEGLEANRDYGAHVHVNACGAEPEQAGPHYQNRKDPKTPSVNPEYANPENEIWLDLSTDDRGNAEAESTVDWQFREGEGQSIVIHDMHTKTGEGEAGTAGDRLACVNIR